MAKKNAISPTRQEDYPEWYQQVVKAADLAEHSVVRGCMVIKPWGWGIWEKMQKYLDDQIKKTGHDNVYFPLFIPLDYFQKEADHIEGFAKECAVVTHHRLEKNKHGELVPAGELPQPLIVRPTSEMIIGETVAKWVESYRDLPVKINQWANVVRWEMRTRLFLRSTEFLWQEGHTFHRTKEEAMEEVRKMLDVYVEFCEKILAMPVYKGKKSESEKFPGADATYTFEAMMQDKKALQGGTSHFLGQNFARSSNISFRDEDGEQKFVYSTSWGSTTRYIGALIMVHSDDDGLVLPPRIAPKQVVLVPMLQKEESKQEILNYCESLQKQLEQVQYHDKAIEVVVDTRDIRGGDKKWSWIKKGIPLIVEVGPRDIASDSVFVTKRKKDDISSSSLKREEFISQIASILDSIQKDLFDKAQAFQKAHTHELKSKEEFDKFFAKEDAGFARVYYKEDAKTEKEIQEKYGVTVRCFLEEKAKEGKCIFSNKPCHSKAIFARAY